jgi:hypothetical protein
LVGDVFFVVFCDFFSLVFVDRNVDVVSLHREP